jgi:hypothetical protein
MPVLRGERVVEARQQTIDHRHHGVALRHREFAAWHEGGLHIH